MGRKLFTIVGRVMFFALYPLFRLYLAKDDRTRVAIWSGGEILMVKSWLGDGSWDLPGGGLHKSEDPKTGACREVAEEIGVTLSTSQLKRPVAVNSRFGPVKNSLLYFEAELESKPALKLQKIEIAEAVWFKQIEIKDLRMESSQRTYINSSNSVL